MPTITGIATGNPNFSILVDVLQFLDSNLGTNLVTTLDTPGANLTVFAPTNDAFGSLAKNLGFGGDPADAPAVTAYLAGALPAATLLAATGRIGVGTCFVVCLVLIGEIIGEDSPRCVISRKENAFVREFQHAQRGCVLSCCR